MVGPLIRVRLGVPLDLLLLHLVTGFALLLSQECSLANLVLLTALHRVNAGIGSDFEESIKCHRRKLESFRSDRASCDLDLRDMITTISGYGSRHGRRYRYISLDTSLLATRFLYIEVGEVLVLLEPDLRKVSIGWRAEWLLMPTEFPAASGARLGHNTLRLLMLFQLLEDL